MTSATELVLTGRAGVLSYLATFVPLEIRRLNHAGLASTEVAFRELAESYMRNVSIRPFMPKITDVLLLPREIVAKTIQAIFSADLAALEAKKPKSTIYRELNPTHLASRAIELHAKSRSGPFFRDPFSEESPRRESMLGIFQRFVCRKD